MFASILGQLTGLLDKRFQLQFFLPALVVSAGGLFVFLAGSHDLDAGVDRWNDHTVFAQVVAVMVALTAVYLLSLLFAAGMLPLLRTYEGYTGPARWSGDEALKWHRQRRDGLEYLAAIEYPVEAGSPWNVLPTRLGNVLRAGELHATARYGVDSVVIWPRLFNLLPSAMVDQLAAARGQLELLVLSSALSAVFGVVAAFFLAWCEVTVAWPFALLLGAMVSAWVLYVGSVSAGLTYANHVRTAFDLHRLKVFPALGMPTPANRDEERRRWDDVNRLLYRGDPTVWWAYVPPDGADAPAPEKAGEEK